MNGRTTIIHTIQWAGLFLLLSAGTCYAHPADTTGYEFHTYVYKSVGTKELKLDVFTPEKKIGITKPFPVIILFHGGGWVSGSRKDFYWQCRYFVRQGIIAITADYRFLQRGAKGVSGTKEICIWDTKSAIRWVRSHTGKLHIDPDKVIIGGGSAGGHLATMAVLDRVLNDPADDTTISTKANALVLFNPAYSIHGAKILQPFHLASSRVPPLIMFFGSNDGKWKPAADTLYSMLKQKGVKCEMWIARGQTHSFFNKAPWNLATCIRAQDFLAKYGLIKSNVPRMPAEVSLIRE